MTIATVAVDPPGSMIVATRTIASVEAAGDPPDSTIVTMRTIASADPPDSTIVTTTATRAIPDLGIPIDEADTDPIEIRRATDVRNPTIPDNRDLRMRDPNATMIPRFPLLGP